MVKSILRPLMRSIRGLEYCFSNLIATAGLAEIPSAQYGEFIFTGLPPHRLAELDHLLGRITKGPTLSFWKKTILKHRGDRLCGVILDGSRNHLVGFQLHSCINREMQKNHKLYLEYSATAPELRNRGLATELKKHLACHFAAEGVNGIIAGTAISNYAELKAAEKAGYKIVAQTKGSVKICQLYLDLSVKQGN